MTQQTLKELIELGKVDQALELATARLKAAREGDDASLAIVLLDEARAQWAHGDRDDALMTVDEAISKARRTFGPTDARYAEALEFGAELAAAEGMPNAAAARFRAAIEILQQVDIRGETLMHALLHHGEFRQTQGDTDGAARAFADVLDRARSVKDPAALPLAAKAFTALGALALEAGRNADARALGDRALEVWLQVGQARRFEVADGMCLVGTAALRQGEAETAAEFLETACRIYRSCTVDVRARHATAAAEYARALDALGRTADAHAAYLGALDLFREGSDARIAIEERLLELAKK